MTVFRFGAKKRKIKKTVFFRRFFYFLILLLFYMLMSGGFFKSWQPVLIIPLAIAFAMQEREFSSAIFGVICGLMIDTACWNLFGVSSIWLMPCALAASLLVTHLMRANFINHLWMTALTCLLMAYMDYFFNYVIWDLPNSGIILRGYIIPSYLSAFLLSPPVYFLVRAVSVKFRDSEYSRAAGPLEADDD